MNKQRRKELAAIIEDLEALKERIEAVRDEEDEAFSNLPEGLQCSERGEAMEENMGDLDGAKDNLDDAIMALQEIIDK